MSSAEWYAKNRERISRERREKYRTDKAHRENTKRRAREYVAKNHAKVLAAKADYRERKRSELAAKQLLRYYRNHEVNKFKAAAKREFNRQTIRAYSKKRSATICDSYVREQLSKYSPLSTHEWPAEIVEAKKLQLRAKRELRSKQNIS